MTSSGWQSPWPRDRCRRNAFNRLENPTGGRSAVNSRQGSLPWQPPNRAASRRRAGSVHGGSARHDFGQRSVRCTHQKGVSRTIHPSSAHHTPASVPLLWYPSYDPGFRVSRAAPGGERPRLTQTQNRSPFVALLAILTPIPHLLWVSTTLGGSSHSCIFPGSSSVTLEKAAFLFRIVFEISLIRLSLHNFKGWTFVSSGYFDFDDD